MDYTVTCLGSLAASPRRQMTDLEERFFVYVLIRLPYVFLLIGLAYVFIDDNSN